jgi:hypothetical protein
MVNMMSMKNRALYILLFIITTVVHAQDVSFTASAPKYVKVGEQFQLQYNVNARVDEFTPPSFDDFDFLGGPMQGTSSNMTIINGKTTRSTQYTLTYYLRANKSGKFTLEPAEAKYKKQLIKSNSIHIEVVGSSSTPSKPSKGSGTGTPAVSGSSNKDLFVSLILSKSSAYVGEQIVAWVKVYTKVQISDIDLRSFKGPEFNGFFVQDVKVPPLRNLEREKVGDDLYYSGLIKEYILTPQRSGKLSIAPFDLTVFQQKQVKRSKSVFDDFFGPSYSSVPVKLTSKGKSLQIKALPQNRPAGFSGAVGKYNIKGTLNASTVKTNEAVTFKIVLSGTGNIKLIENLLYDLSTLEQYDPVIKTSMNSDGLGGTKTFEFTAIPRYSGTYEIKPFKLIYFDPSAGEYKTIQTQPFVLVAEKNAGDTNSVMVSNLSKKDVELLGSDIRYIKTRAKLKVASVYYIDNITYYLYFIFSIVLFIAIIVIKRKQIKDNADVAKTKNRKANKMAQRRLKDAKNYLQQKKNDQFYEELSRALWGYISDKLNIPVSQLSAENARLSLTKKGISQELVDELLQLINQCEYTRYAPGGNMEQPEEMYATGVKLILRIDQKI